MSKGKAFSCSLLCFLLITAALLQQTCAANTQQTCVPSSCGKITNIMHPFRLKDDPAACGDPRYELACENNITVLYLFPGKYYYVQAINYRNFTIRLVDPGISEADYSPIPHFFLSSANFTDSYDYEPASDENGDPYQATQRLGTQLLMLFEHVIYLNCSNAVRDDPQYVDTAPYINWHSEGHVYAIARGLRAVDLKADCRMKLVAASSFFGPREYSTLANNYNQGFSYPEIHRMLSYGFDVSWMSRACEDLCSSRHSYYCFFNETRQNVGCEYIDCYTPLGFYHCGKKTSVYCFR